MVESFEIEVPYVPTSDNVADFFTKPMKSASQFFAFRRIIMNEPRDSHVAALAFGLGRSRPSSAGGRLYSSACVVPAVALCVTVACSLAGAGPLHAIVAASELLSVVVG